MVYIEEMREGDKVEFILFSERIFGQIHRVNKEYETFDIVVEGIIYPNAKVYKKRGLNPYTTASRKAIKNLTPWYILK